MENKYIGKSERRARIIDRVTGAQKYTDDRKVEGMLYVKLLRSTHARAKILSVDFTEALGLEGVVAVITGEDCKPKVPKFGSTDLDQPILAVEEVKYYGEPVAAVIAVSQETADRAVNYIRVNYEVMRPVIKIEEALDENAPLVHEVDNEGHKRTSNVYKEFNYCWGDVEGEKQNCDYILNNVYNYPMVYHFPIENYSCIAAPEDDGVVIWAPIQHPFILRRVIGLCLGLPFSKVRVIAEEIGGGFGGKGYPKIEPLAAYLSMKLRRPIKIQLNMNEGFMSARRISARINITTGFNNKGQIMFQDIKTDYLMGAYVDAAPRVIAKSNYLCCGPYKVNNMKMTAKAIYSNTVSGTAFRGFGMPQLVFAIESQLNEASRYLKIDPVEIRRRNLPKKGETLVPGDIPCDGDWIEALNKTAELIEWDKARGENQGKGIAIGIKSGIHGSVSNAVVIMHSDCSVTVYCGTTEMGQGARTVMAQFAAERLGIEISKVSVVLGDTGAVPFDISTAGSRSTVSMGTAVINACDDVIKQIKNISAQVYEELPEDIEIKDGSIIIGMKTISFEQIMKDYFGIYQGDIIGRGNFTGRKVKGHPLGGKADFWEFVISASDINIDRNTGKITVNKLAAVSDIGKVINHLQAEGQEEGGSLMGLGQALTECLVYSEDGVLLNGNPLDYCIPTIEDIPKDVASYFVENEDGPGPYGSKGLGEGSAIPVGPSITGAIYDATGIVFRTLPVTREKMYFAINDKVRND